MDARLKAVADGVQGSVQRADAAAQDMRNAIGQTEGKASAIGTAVQSMPKQVEDVTSHAAAPLGARLGGLTGGVDMAGISPRGDRLAHGLGLGRLGVPGGQRPMQLHRFSAPLLSWVTPQSFWI